MHDPSHHDHGHTHEHLDHPGRFEERQKTFSTRDFSQRAFTVGVGGPVGESFLDVWRRVEARDRGLAPRGASRIVQ